jgi:hypothetical protein
MKCRPEVGSDRTLTALPADGARSLLARPASCVSLGRWRETKEVGLRNPTLQMPVFNDVSCNCPTTCWTNPGRGSCGRLGLCRSTRLCLPSSWLTGCWPIGSCRCRHRQTGSIEPRLFDRLSGADQSTFQVSSSNHVECNSAATCCTNSGWESAAGPAWSGASDRVSRPKAIGQQAVAQFGSGAPRISGVGLIDLAQKLTLGPSRELSDAAPPGVSAFGRLPMQMPKGG